VVRRGLLAQRILQAVDREVDRGVAVGVRVHLHAVAQRQRETSAASMWPCTARSGVGP
jgi:hypothetical protein